MGQKGDNETTKQVLNDYKNGTLEINHYMQSWLRHGAGTQAARIDWMIPEGKYSIEEIASSISGKEYGPARTKKHRIDRVKGHIRHLEEDSQNGSQEPHYLKINKLNDIVFFD